MWRMSVGFHVTLSSVQTLLFILMLLLVCIMASPGNKGIRNGLEPKIKGLDTVQEVEIGQNLTLKCKALVGLNLLQLFWVQNTSSSDELEKIVNDCPPFITRTCSTTLQQQGEEAFTDLHIISVNENDTKYPYECILITTSNTEIRKFNLTVKAKNPDISKSVFTTSVAASMSCCISMIVLFVLCILFRIEIILLYRNLSGLDETTGDSKEYDAYLSFASYSNLEAAEREFIFNILAPILENCFGFKICIFERDVTPGGAVVDDMHTFFEKSRRLIIVLSKNYTSDEAMLEFESGLHKAMVERKIKVILIEFTPLSELSVIPESLQLLKSRNKVKWEGERSHQLNSRFWKKVQYLMPAKPVKSQSQYHKVQNLQILEKREME